MHVSVSFLIRTSGTGRRQQLRGKPVVVSLGYSPCLLRLLADGVKGWFGNLAVTKEPLVRLVFDVCQDTSDQKGFLHKSTRAYWHLVVGFQTAVFWSRRCKRTEKKRRRGSRRKRRGRRKRRRRTQRIRKGRGGEEGQGPWLLPGYCHWGLFETWNPCHRPHLHRSY